MTQLRQQMVRELELKRRSPDTVKAYVTAVAELAKFYHRSPDQISLEEIRTFLHHLIVQRKLSYSTCNQKMAAMGTPRLTSAL